MNYECPTCKQEDITENDHECADGKSGTLFNNKGEVMAQWGTMMAPDIPKINYDVVKTEEPEPEFVYNNHIEGPNSAHLPTWVHYSAGMCNLKVIEVNSDKGWFRTSVHYKVQGTEKNYNRHMVAWNTAILGYNG